MVFQDYALWPHLTVSGNVSYALRRRHIAHAESQRRVLDALDQVDSRASPTAIRISCRAANSNVWRWHARWSRARAAALR